MHISEKNRQNQVQLVFLKDKHISFMYIKEKFGYREFVVVVQSTLCDPMDSSMPGLLSLTISQSLPKFMSIALVMPSSHLILWCPLSSCLQSFLGSGTFPMSQLFKSGDQNTGASASASVLLMSIQGWSPLRLTGLISLLSKGHSGVFSSTIVRRHQFFCTLPSLWSISHNPTWSLGRP